MTAYKIAILDGDGIGPEIMAEAVKILKLVAERNAIELELLPGAYTAKWFDPRNGAWTELPNVEVKRRTWTSPKTKGEQDWVLLLQKRS